MYLNKAVIIGNLTKDPELKSLPNGNKVCSFSVATNRSYKDAAGNKKEEVEYHNIVVFGRVAETSGQYLKKGQQAMIEGRIVTRSWDDANGGGKKYRTEIVADSVQFGPKAGGMGVVGQDSAAPSQASNNASSSSELDTIDYGEIINPDDIPF